jgi:asparaginyl-tRNA synthetase
MIEPEIAFADLVENMDIAEQYVKFVLSYAMEQCPEEFQYLETFEKKAVIDLAKGASEEEKAKKKSRSRGEKKHDSGTKKS